MIQGKRLSCKSQLFTEDIYPLNPEYHDKIANHLNSPNQRGLIKSSNHNLSFFWVRECENTVDAILTLLSFELELFDTESRGVNDAVDICRLLGGSKGTRCKLAEIMPYALVSLYCIDNDTIKKTPAVQFFDTREEAVAKCAKELTYNSDWVPWVPAMRAAIEEYFAKNPENHFPLSNWAGGSGTMFMIREAADKTKDTRRSLYSAILEAWSSVHIDDLKPIL